MRTAITVCVLAALLLLAGGDAGRHGRHDHDRRHHGRPHRGRDHGRHH